MKIVYVSTLSSTQNTLISQIKQDSIKSDTCIVAHSQTNGIGSRGNKWSNVEKGLYFSFAKSLKSLPNDLQSQSMAIFFAFIFMKTLRNLGSKIWLKYPNDLFLENDKIGGVICSVVGVYAVCGIGLNIKSNNFASIEANIGDSLQDSKSFLEAYFHALSQSTWSEVFNAYKLEFYKNQAFSFHYNNEILSLKNATLQSDGAIKINDKIFYNIR